MTNPAAEEVLNRLGLGRWAPPGHFDETTGTWFVDRNVPNSFPDAGIDVFRDVDGHSFWFDHRNTVIASMLARHAPSHAMLEVGSGSGVVAEHLTDQGWAVACVEPVAAGAVTAARRGVPASFCGDLASLKLPDGSLPAIGAFDVIEHLEDPLPLLAEARRALRPDGVLAITVPAYQWLWSDFDTWNGHFRRYTLASLKEEVEAAGFVSVAGTYLFSPLVLPAAASRLLLNRSKGHRSADEIEAQTASDLSPPNPTVDRLVRSILAAETHWLRRRPLWFGTSVGLIATADGS